MQPLKKLDEFFLGTTQAASPFGAVWSGEQLCVDVDRVHVVLDEFWPRFFPEEPQAPWRDRRRQWDDWCFARAEAIG